MNCEDFDDWENMTHEERFDALERLINEQLFEEGYLTVGVDEGDLGDDSWAETDWDGTNITFDSDGIDEGSVRDMIDTANHEAEHVRQAQDGYSDGIEHMYEDDAWGAGFASMLEWEEECQPDPESPSGDGGDGGGGGDGGVVIDYEEMEEGGTP